MNRYLFITALLLPLLTWAQPVFNATDVLPQQGENYGAQAFDASGIFPGPSGANQSWDFSTLQSLGTEVTQVVDPATTPHGSDYGDANLAVGEDSSFLYYKGSASAFEFYGLTTNENSAVYTDPEEHLIFPLTYGTSNTDVFNGIGRATISGFGQLSTFRYGTGQMEADGYGTLILPTGTYNDVLRVKFVSMQTDSVSLFFIDSVVNTTITSYQWLKAGTHAPLLSITEISTELQPQPIYRGTYYDHTVGINMPERTAQLTGFRVSPNVSAISSRISFELNEAGQVNISLVNLLGEVALQHSEGRRQKGSYRETLSLEGLQPGIYFVMATFGEQVVTEKLIIP